MNKFEMLEVGKPFKKGVVEYDEGCKIDITDNGIEIFLYYKGVTKRDIQDVSSGSKVKCGLITLGDVIFFLFKFGNANWIDMPYSVHLSKHLSSLKEVSGIDGYATHIYLINADNGNLEHMRMIGLPTEFSQEIYSEVMDQKTKLFDCAKYAVQLQDTYLKYSTKQLVNMAKTIYNAM